jgi:type I restriction enzyme S subunit
MIADLKPYAEYKESGLPWLGHVPGHWDVRRLRASITDCFNGVWGAEPNGEDDLICVRVADFDRVGLRVSLRKKTVRAIPMSARARRVLQRGDLLLEKSGGGDLQPVGAVVAYDHDEPAVCSNFVARMPLAGGYDPFFVNYLHFTLYANRVNIRSIKQTTGIQNLDGKAYLSELVAFPPPDEQVAIVRFLDWANGRLERAIRAKRKVISLLNEQKQAIIHRAVTRGLDPSVPLKPSGSRWFPEHPAGWEALTLRRVITSAIDGPHFSPQYQDAGIPFLSARNVRADRWILGDVKFISESDYIEFSRRVRPEVGDVLYTKGGTTGVARVVDLDFPFQVWVHIAVLKLKRDRMVPAFLAYCLNSRRCYEQAQLFTRGATNQDLGLGRMKEIELPVPPTLDEQSAIVDFLDSKCSAFHTVITRLEREIELLREYRTRLVADVVAGKLDVRKAAASLPEASDEPDATKEEIASVAAEYETEDVSDEAANEMTT